MGGGGGGRRHSHSPWASLKMFFFLSMILRRPPGSQVPTSPGQTCGNASADEGQNLKPFKDRKQLCTLPPVAAWSCLPRFVVHPFNRVKQCSEKCSSRCWEGSGKAGGRDRPQTRSRIRCGGQKLLWGT